MTARQDARRGIQTHNPLQATASNYTKLCTGGEARHYTQRFLRYSPLTIRVQFAVMMPTDRTPARSLQLALSSTVAFLQHLRQRTDEDDCLRSAAALTYLSLLALVPLMTVAYAMLSAVPAFAQIGVQVQPFLFEHFVPSTGQEIQNYLQGFSTQARNLTGIGVLFLVGTAYGMLANIERTLNAIWRTPHRRSGLRSFLLYWAILSLGPLCIGLAIGISTYLLSLQVLLDNFGILGWPAGGIKALLLGSTPLLLTSAAFALTYAAVPNCKVPLRDALIGGIIAGLCFEVAKHLFTFALASSYQRVYGTFAALPLFLIWIYLSWAIVLIGAELVFAISGYAERHTRHLPDLLVATAVMEQLWLHQQRGEALDPRMLVQAPWLLNRYPLPVDRWSRLRAQLQEAGWLQLNEEGDFLLGRDLHQMTLWQLAELLGQTPAEQAHIDSSNDPAWLAPFGAAMARWRHCGNDLLNIPLATLFSPAPLKDTP